jgi:hypothetical protein
MFHINFTNLRYTYYVVFVTCKFVKTYICVFIQYIVFIKDFLNCFQKIYIYFLYVPLIYFISKLKQEIYFLSHLISNSFKLLLLDFFCNICNFNAFTTYV